MVSKRLAWAVLLLGATAAQGQALKPAPLVILPGTITANLCAPGVCLGGPGGIPPSIPSAPLTLVERDANSNAAAQNFVQGQQKVATAGATTTYTIASPHSTIFTGTLAQTAVLPDATTLAPPGSFQTTFEINDNSTGAITVQDNSTATLYVVTAGADCWFNLQGAGSAAGTWDWHCKTPVGTTWGTSGLAFAGPITLNANTDGVPTPVTGMAVQIVGANSAGAIYQTDTFAAGGGFSLRRADGTDASKTALQTGDIIGSFNAYGYDGSGYGSSANASMRQIADGNWSNTSHPTRLDFLVTAASSTSQSAVGSVKNTGDWLIGTSTDNATDKLQVAGSGYIQAPLRSTGTAPTVATNACGSAVQGSITAGGNDNDFKVTAGTSSVTACTITFANTWVAAPTACVLIPANASGSAYTTTKPYISSLSATQMVISGIALDNCAYYVHCG